ncbi:cytochrome c family protein [Solemya velum gill symbiont]|nr:cytochrome c family protein [Solemya velum gill symbiont]OOY57222.1 cytochrome c family protein [Solemya velum gill symbiont]OOY58417.1 cytochrome c family protein [Solemya velum gill symbiont]OOY62069.1 cytochrome c family protein [Solemya velum gill symbiont]OOY63694.1 cytochrome c family protein [Solemya velum gill symbiont]
MIVFKLHSIIPALALLIGYQINTPVLAADQPLHHVSSETCQLCHKEVYKQWKGSMHAQSSALKDPIHATFYKKVVGDPKEEGVKMKNGKYPVCLMCHAPNAARDKKTKLDTMPAYSEGVNCVACHTLKKFKGTSTPEGKPQLGLKAYETANAIQAPAGFSNELQKLTAAADSMFGGALEADGDKKPNPHLGESVMLDGEKIPSLPMERNAQQMKSSDACMGCHDKRSNSKKVPLCATGDEYAKSKSEVDCLACHMPVADGIANHGMGGGHDQAMLKRAVIFDVTTKSEGDMIKAAVSMQNMQPHSLPTGAPFRNMYMKLTAYDASGNVVWENAKGHPKEDDPQAYLLYELYDDNNVHALPPVATKLGPDTRLKPFETRVLNYDIPAKGVVLVRGELFYNLLWPGLVKKFSHLPTDLTAPVSVAVAEVKL